jgi:hypothetical protein
MLQLPALHWTVPQELFWQLMVAEAALAVRVPSQLLLPTHVNWQLSLLQTMSALQLLLPVQLA